MGAGKAFPNTKKQDGGKRERKKGKERKRGKRKGRQKKMEKDKKGTGKGKAIQKHLESCPLPHNWL